MNLKVTIIGALMYIFSPTALSENMKIITLDMPPYAMPESKDGREGLTIDIAKYIFSKSGISLETKITPWKRGQVMVTKSNNLIITPLTRTPHRETKYDWIVPIFKYDLVIVSNNDDIPIKSLDLMREKSVCVVRDTPGPDSSTQIFLVE